MKSINCPNILGAFLDPIQIHQPRNKGQGDLPCPELSIQEQPMLTI